MEDTSFEMVLAARLRDGFAVCRRPSDDARCLRTSRKASAAGLGLRLRRVGRVRVTARNDNVGQLQSCMDMLRCLTRTCIYRFQLQHVLSIQDDPSLFLLSQHGRCTLGGRCSQLVLVPLGRRCV